MALFTDIDIQAYHDHSSLSSSKIKVFAQEGPEAYDRTFNLKTMPRPPKSNFDVGNAFECLLFEGNAAYGAKYICKPPGMSFATTEGKAWKKDRMEEGLAILTQDGIPDLWAVFQDMLRAVMANPFAVRLMASGRAQVTVRRDLEALGVSAQCRPDWLNKMPCQGITEGAYTVNLKTTADLDLYARHCVELGYHYQASLEQFLLAKEGIITDHFQLVCEKKLAPRCRVFRIPETILAAGWSTVKTQISAISSRYKSGVWTDIQSEISEVQIPSWQQRKVMEAVEE